MKGSILDVLYILVIVFVLAIIVMVGNTFLVDVYENVNETEAINSSHVQSGIEAVRSFDVVMPFVLIGLLASVAVMAFLIPTHPVLIIPVLFAIILIVVVAAQFTNMYDTIATNDQLIDEANQMTMTTHIMNNLPLIATVCGAVVIIAMFMISRRPEVTS
jgi:hypothetical protein